MTDSYSTTPGLVNDTPRPFQEAFEETLARGWEVLPLPHLAKSKPPHGLTGGYEGRLSIEEAREWAEKDEPHNIGVRPPKGVIGIDVDAYGIKPGAANFRDLEQKLGKLPLTVMTTRRYPRDDVSGIRWYRLPSGEAKGWQGIFASGIELIRHGHRYGVAPPSLAYENYYESSGPILKYQAVDLRTGMVSDVMPRVEDLPMLPMAWFEHCENHASLPWIPQDEEVEWLTDGDCARVNKHVDRFRGTLLNGSRHDSMKSVTFTIARLGANGHGGTRMALERIRHMFLESVQGESIREAEKEFARAVDPLAWKVNKDHNEICRGLDCSEIEDMSEILGVGDETKDFWERSPIRQEIFRQARWATLNEWAVLGAVITRVLSAVSHEVVIPGPPIEAPFNLFTILLGNPASGKTATMALARRLVPIPDVMWREPGSGEGILTMFGGKANLAKGIDEEVSVGSFQRTNWNAGLEVDEISTLDALSQRTAGTLQGFILSAFSGAPLGTQNADENRRRHIEAMSYRLCLLIGTLGSHVDVILKDEDRGFPQRFLWLPAHPRKGAWTAKSKGEDPGPIKALWAPPAHQRARAVYLPEGAEAEREHNNMLRIDYFDSQAGRRTELRMRVAFALAMLEGRNEMSDQDWEDSDVIMGLHDRTVEYAKGLNQRAKHDAQRKAGFLAGIKATSKEEAREQIELNATVELIVKHAKAMTENGRGPTNNQIKKQLSPKRRGRYAMAVKLAIEQGLIAEDGARIQVI